ALDVLHLAIGSAAGAGIFGDLKLVRDLIADQWHDPIVEVGEEELGGPSATRNRVPLLVHGLDDVEILADVKARANVTRESPSDGFTGSPRVQPWNTPGCFGCRPDLR